MEDDAPVIYGLEFQGRAVAARAGETDSIFFLVGTQSLKHDNQLHVLEFDDESNYIEKQIFSHLAGEINHISTSVADKDLLATCHSAVVENKVKSGATVWRLPSGTPSTLALDLNSSGSQIGSGTLPELERVAELGGHDGVVRGTQWHPGGNGSRLVSVDHKNLRVWDLKASSGSAKQVSCATLDVRPTFSSVRWNPHFNCSQVGTAVDSGVQGWDLRSMKTAFSIENAHGQLVRDLDFNPNRQYYMATCGDDCLVKFWDQRKIDAPLKICQSHSHWVWSVRFNPFHDQLVTSSSSDSRVILHGVPSLSSEPIASADDEEDPDTEKRDQKPLTDGELSRYEEHEDSVYAAEWSAADPWVFASLSYDGRLVINRVPRNTKYQILL
ncbi:EARP and GARP complex-interacting protein 1-like [Sycon ciliatum]|uniref:EARP and GARP complex-interacting protein 1-like n=1 Tax=Sycon ciliatum TaxID=27933 RepID=UPI0031F6D506|eukprot:scpid50393/ scgid23517/ Protein TSSC1